MTSTFLSYTAAGMPPAQGHPLLRFLASVVKGGIVLTAATAIIYMVLALVIIGSSLLLQ
ncbi:MAG: hypothetical protein H7840_12640 [Alphaproteobacteria bacterium]